jgi:hypothetical protein
LTEKVETAAAHCAKLSEDIVVLEDKLLLQSFGLYEPLYALRNSDEYRDRLDEIRAKQAAMVKAGEAAHCPTGWQVNNSKKEGERMIRDYSKLIVRAFNNECDAATTAVKFNNIASVEKRIQKAFDTLNKLGKRMSISIVAAYLSLKLEELHLCYEYQLKKQERIVVWITKGQTSLQHQSLGSTASLSIASTPNTHSCTRRSGSLATNRSSPSTPNANSRTARLRFAFKPAPAGAAGSRAACIPARR